MSNVLRSLCEEFRAGLDTKPDGHPWFKILLESFSLEAQQGPVALRSECEAKKLILENFMTDRTSLGGKSLFRSLFESICPDLIEKKPPPPPKEHSPLVAALLRNRKKPESFPPKEIIEEKPLVIPSTAAVVRSIYFDEPLTLDDESEIIVTPVTYTYSTGGNNCIFPVPAVHDNDPTIHTVFKTSLALESYEPYFDHGYSPVVGIDAEAVVEETMELQSILNDFNLEVSRSLDVHGYQAECEYIQATSIAGIYDPPLDFVKCMVYLAAKYPRLEEITYYSDYDAAFNPHFRVLPTHSVFTGDIYMGFLFSSTNHEKKMSILARREYLELRVGYKFLLCHPKIEDEYPYHVVTRLVPSEGHGFIIYVSEGVYITYKDPHCIGHYTMCTLEKYSTHVFCSYFIPFRIFPDSSSKLFPTFDAPKKKAHIKTKLLSEGPFVLNKSQSFVGWSTSSCVRKLLKDNHDFYFLESGILRYFHDDDVNLPSGLYYATINVYFGSCRVKLLHTERCRGFKNLSMSLRIPSHSVQVYGFNSKGEILCTNYLKESDRDDYVYHVLTTSFFTSRSKFPFLIKDPIASLALYTYRRKFGTSIRRKYAKFKFPWLRTEELSLD